MHSAHEFQSRRFVERFADYWSATGASRIEGLIAGYLLVDESEGVSPSELATRLGISAGSVSSYTRALVERGFVRRVRRPGERSHFFVMDEDVWAGFLAREQEYLTNQRRLAEETLPLVREGGKAWERVRNMRDYMGWLIDSRLGGEWARFKAERDARER
ncbi:MarR family transcriptional regulator [Kineosporia sp. J2-2]|uniref:MarR family transcriptional regulator n=1 Tax=Kineosporia corallincola TaxID=2835133 RepID=A0ABS5TQL0_9ACTN|nr:MarR family transcriptional regulator [Kineosporia corallincola]MBT0772526.1 MarR family transcriptional regulator [Kineosporia corallincola]